MVAAGRTHTVSLSEAGHVFSWGYGMAGQLGHDDWEQQGAAAGGGRAVRGENVVFVAAWERPHGGGDGEGRLYTWGVVRMVVQAWRHRRQTVPTLVGAGAFGGRRW